MNRSPLRVHPGIHRSTIPRKSNLLLQNAENNGHRPASLVHGTFCGTTSHPGGVQNRPSASGKARQSLARIVRSMRRRSYSLCCFQMYYLYRAGIAIRRVSSIADAYRTTSTIYKYALFLFPVTDYLCVFSIQ